MKMLELCENTSGKHFKRIIDCCFSCSDLVTLSRFGGQAEPVPPNHPIGDKIFREVIARHDKVLAKFSGYRIGTIKAMDWFYTKALITPMYIDLYPVSEQVKDIVLSVYDNFFLDTHKSGYVFQGDICFFKNGVSWLASCSHECVCYARPENEAVASALLQNAVWRETEKENEVQGWMPVLADYEIIK